MSLFLAYSIIFTIHSQLTYPTVPYCTVSVTLISSWAVYFGISLEEYAIQWLKKRQIVLALQKKLNFFNFVS